MTDPIADMLTRIRNAVRIEAPSVDVPYSNLKREIARVLVEEGFLVQFETLGEGKDKLLRIQLKYGLDGEHVIRLIDRVSKPGRRVYRHTGDLKPVLSGMGIMVLTTSQGVMSDRQARAKKIGGEVLCQVY
jgi:small subunit ribosomal protein S8